MKFVRYDHAEASEKQYTAEEAVQAATDRAAHMCDGTVEALRARVDCLQEMVGRLIDQLPEGTKTDRKRAAAVIGYDWEPAE